MKRFLALMAIAACVHAAMAGIPAVQMTAKPEREFVDLRASHECIIQFEIVAQPSSSVRRFPINLALVLDRSGSMEGAKLEKARQAACTAIDRLSADDIFSVVVYDDQVDVLIAPKKVGDKDALKAMIRAIEAGGSTALYAGVQKGAQQLRKYLDDECVNRVILLSDGLANVGPSTPADLAVLGKELKKEGISVSTIGVGDDYNEDLMTALAEASHANYYYVKDAEGLPGVFEEELGMAATIVARKLELIITFPDAVRPRGVLGEDGIVFSGQSVKIPVEDLSGSQVRRFLVACDVPERESGAIDVAKAELRYLDVAANTPRNEDATATIRFTKDSAQAERSIRAEVAGNIAVVRNRLAKERAVSLADAGRPQEAAKVLRSQIAANAALPAPAQRAIPANENSALERKVVELQRAGSLSKSSRKEIQYENYQDKKQKR